MPTQSKFAKYFKILGLRTDATESDIKDARNRLARSYHPDKVNNNEKEEANTYMAKVNEAYRILLEDCLPTRSALEHRCAIQEDATYFQQSQSVPAKFLRPEEVPNERGQRGSNAAEKPPQSSITNTDGQISMIQSPFGIDVGQIRIEFSEMTKDRLIEYCRQLGFIQSDLELKRKDSKADNVIFATSQKVRTLLLENHCPPSDLEHYLEQLCQTSLTARWAHNSKTACRDELIDTHGYNHTRMAKWTHWQLINELVKISTQSSTIPAERPTNAIKTKSNPTTTLSPASCPLAAAKLMLYHPQSHPELIQQTQNYALPHLTKSSTTLHREQCTVTLSHATNLTLSSASRLLLLNNNSLDAALAYHTHIHSKFPSAGSADHLTYLSPNQQLVMRLSRETGLTAEWAGRCLDAYNFDYEAAKGVFEEQKTIGQIQTECFVPDRKVIGWIGEQKDEEMIDE